MLRAVEDNCHIRKGFLIIEFLKLRKLSLIHSSSSYYEHCKVSDTVRYSCISNDTYRHVIHNDNVISLSKLGYHLIKSLIHQELSRIWSLSSSWDIIHIVKLVTLENNVVKLNICIIQIVCNTYSVTITQMRGHCCLTDIKVHHTHLLASQCKTCSQVCRNEGLTCTLIE